MKIDSNLFSRYVTKASCNGEIATLNIDFRDDGIYTSVYDGAGTIMTEASLESKYFVDYTKLGELFVKDSKALLKYIKSFKGEIELVKKGEYTLVLKNAEREVFVILGADIVCDNKNKKPFPQLEWAAEIELTIEKLKALTSDMSLVGLKEARLETKDNQLVLTVGFEETSDRVIHRVDVGSINKSKVGFGDKIIHLINVMDNKVKLSLGTDMPAKFVEDSPDIKFSCLIAPRTGDD